MADTTDFRTPMPRNERGQFLPRNDKDTPISVVLAQEEEKRQASAEHEEETTERKKPEKKATAKNAQVDEAASQFYEEFFGDGSSTEADKEKETVDKSKSKDKEKEKDKEPDKDKQAESEKDKEKGKQTPPPRRAATPPPAMSPEQIATLAAEAAARVHASQKKEEPKKDVEPELPPGEQRKINTLKHMETMYGDKYAGAVRRYQTAQTKLKNYASQWEKDNPGKRFDESAEEHEQFFADNDLFEFWDADDFDEARIDLIAEKKGQAKAEERNREINAKLSKLERAERLREEAPKVRETQIKAAGFLWKNFGEQYAEVMGEKGWNKEKSEELAKADPVGYSHRFAVAKDFDREAGEIYKLYNGLVDFNPKDDVHKEITDFYMRFESAMLKAPADIRTNQEGKTFMSSKEYYALPEDKRDRYWTFTADDVIFKRAQTLAKEVESSIRAEEERLARYAEAKGWKKPDGDGQRKETPDKDREKEEEETDGKPGGPSAGSETKVAALKNVPGKDEPNSKKTFFEDF